MSIPSLGVGASDNTGRSESDNRGVGTKLTSGSPPWLGTMVGIPPGLGPVGLNVGKAFDGPIVAPSDEGPWVTGASVSDTGCSVILDGGDVEGVSVGNTLLREGPIVLTGVASRLG